MSPPHPATRASLSAGSLPTGPLLRLLCPCVLWSHPPNLPWRGEFFSMGEGEQGPRSALWPHIGESRGVVSEFSGKTKSW